jgi:3-hydroxybutyryl-CoA dehydratase
VIGLSIDSIRAGDRAEITRRATAGDIAEFVDAVGDYNPVHSDREYAAGTVFKEPIAPGIWTAGLISAVIGTRLPGPGAIYLSQSLKFLRPVRFNDVITARVDVLETNPEKNRMRLRTTCTNQHGEEVLTGEALVMPPAAPVVYSKPNDGAGLLAAWTLAPWAWAIQGAAVWSMLGLSSLVLGGAFDTYGVMRPDRSALVPMGERAAGGVTT